MTYDNLIKGMTILAKYAPEGLETAVGASHDRIYFLDAGGHDNTPEEAIPMDERAAAAARIACLMLPEAAGAPAER